MANWFPDVSEDAGVTDAKKSGLFGALAFAAMILLGAILLLMSERTPVMGQTVESPIAALIGMLVELAFVLFAAWRFHVGKGKYIGIALLTLYMIEIGAKVLSGTTNVGWMVAYAAILVALVNGVRGAWANRSKATIEDEVFN